MGPNWVSDGPQGVGRDARHGEGERYEQTWERYNSCLSGRSRALPVQQTEGLCLLLFALLEGYFMKKVAVIMGSDSDLPVMREAVEKLKHFGIPYTVRVLSAHRTPADAERFASSAAAEGYGVLIAGAGKAAHLGGVLAAYTTLPVIGVPIKTSMMGGLDSLLSMVQMPSGIPVATVGVNGAANAGILAAQLLALSEPELAEKLSAFKAEMAEGVRRKDAAVQEQL